MVAGIRDKVAVIGMGCSRFGERWDCDADDLIVEAYSEAISDTNIDPSSIEAAWSSVAIEEQFTGKSGIPLANALRLPQISVSFCAASGFEALRAASYAIASGACEVALAMGYEKLKDTGYGGIPQRNRVGLNSLYWPNISPPGAFSQLANAYLARHKIERATLDRATALIAVNSHLNGSRNPKAHLKTKISTEDVLASPIVADPIRLLHCCGVSDGAACAILCSPAFARERGYRTVVSVKGRQQVVSNGFEAQMNVWDGSYLNTTRIAAPRAYNEAGITDPRSQIGLLELHDCFSIAELVTIEDLFISGFGKASRDIIDGVFTLDGAIPAQTDGGLKCFGHPIGASGIRMLYEIYLQLLERAGDRQIRRPLSYGLAQSLSGYPHQNASSIAIFGLLNT
jgi:acetyl-CoA C-acetyltransferase